MKETKLVKDETMSEVALGSPKTRRAVAGLVLALVLTAAGAGCGTTRPGHRTSAGPVAGVASAPVAPRATPAAASETPSAEVIEAQAKIMAEPREPYWPYHVAEIHVASGSTAEAEWELLASLAIDPHYTPALLLLSKLDFAAGRHERAVERLAEALDRPAGLDAQMTEALQVALALHLDAIGEVDRAEVLIARAVADGLDWRSHGSAATFLRLRGQSDLAGDPAALALENDRESAVNLNNHGIIRLQAGDPSAAREAFVDAHARDPRLPGPLYNLAIVERYYFFNDDAANEWFDRYWSLSHDDPDGLADVFAPEGVAGGGDGRLAERGEGKDR